jgi:hypothetical protein
MVQDKGRTEMRLTALIMFNFVPQKRRINSDSNITIKHLIIQEKDRTHYN